MKKLIACCAAVAAISIVWPVSALPDGIMFPRYDERLQRERQLIEEPAQKALILFDGAPRRRRNNAVAIDGQNSRAADSSVGPAQGAHDPL